MLLWILSAALAAAAAQDDAAYHKWHTHPHGHPRLRREGPYYVYEKAPVAAPAQKKATQAALAFASGLYAGKANDFRNGMKKQGGPAAPPAHALVPAVRKALKQGRLTLAFTGMSAAEGAGNYLNESFPYVVQRLIAPAFAAAGVETWTSNFALGATHSRPHPSFCLAGTFGRNVDAAFWWFDMTERGNGGPEAFAAGLTRAYGPIPITIASSKPEGKAQAAAKFAAGPVLSYAMNSAIGNDKALDKNPNCVQALMAPEGKCDTSRYHPHTGDAAHRRGCGGQVSWHPGWATHQAYGTGMALAWLDALTLVQTGAKVQELAVNKPGPPPDANDGLLRKELHDGLACRTGYRPHAGSNIYDLVDPKQRAKVRDHPTQTAANKKDAEDASNEGAAGCRTGHPDWKGGLAISQDMGPVTLVLPKVKRGSVFICEPVIGLGGRVTLGSPTTIKENVPVKFSANGQPLTFKEIPGNGKPQHCFKSAPTLANRLTIEVLEGGANNALRLSHVIWPSDDVLQ